MLIVGEAAQHAPLAASIEKFWRLPEATETQRFSYDSPASTQAQGWSTSTQVSFCAEAYPAVSLDHPDAPALQVLGNFLRNGYLHRAIREQGGAYGGGAGYHADSATFRFFSYRDPRFAETYKDFNGALDWLQRGNHNERALEEAILGVVSAIDRPGSPAGEAITAFYASLFGRTPELRRALRQEILGVTVDDLKRVAAEYFEPGRSSRAAVSSAETLKQQDGWRVTAV